MRLLKKPAIYKLLVCLIADGLLFSSTDTSNSSSIILMIGFIVLMTTVYYLLFNLLSIGRLYNAKFKHQKRLAASLSGVIAILIALQSIGELSPRDAAVLLPLGALIYLYSSYGAAKRDQLL